MNDTTFPELFELFAPQRRDATYRVLFADGDDYDLKAVLAYKDFDEPPHADGLVVKCRRGVVSDGALFFRLADVVEVRDATSGEIRWSAA